MKCLRSWAFVLVLCGVGVVPSWPLRADNPSSVGVGGTFNVKDFGAKGDGVADDSAAIRAALDAVGQAGGMLKFPAGTYKLLSSLGVRTASNVTLIGDGPGATTLWFPVEGGILLTIGADQPTPTARHVLIEGMQLSGRRRGPDLGPATPDFLLRFVNVEDITVRDVYLHHAVQNNIEFYRAAAGGKDVAYGILLDHIESDNAGSGVQPPVAAPAGCGISAARSRARIFMSVVDPRMQSNETGCLCGPFTVTVTGGFCGGVQGALGQYGFDLAANAEVPEFGPIAIQGTVFENIKGRAAIRLKQIRGASLSGITIATSNPALAHHIGIEVVADPGHSSAGVAIIGSDISAHNTPPDYVGIQMGERTIEGLVSGISYEGTAWDEGTPPTRKRFSGKVGGTMLVDQAGVGDPIFAFRRANRGYQQLQMVPREAPDGLEFRWGPGDGAPPDTMLYRAGIHTLKTDGIFEVGSTTFAGLGAAHDGAIVYCANCTTTAQSPSCIEATHAGGALARRVKGVWVCN